ncbi:MAG TPA: hypothetical protein DF613_04665 [Lachnospiraceae bacterium]|nr:hypothetical protein [Lachnospiraceae bacterium]
MNENKKNESKSVAKMSEIGRQGYEASVMSRMQGRAGASTPKGASGIAHEVIANDIANVKNILKPGTVTKLTKSPTAKQVDAVTMQGGKVLERIQYKDTSSVSGINKTLRQVQDGKYHQVQLRGTKETAKKFNQMAAKRGISKTMESTGISSNTTRRIGDKFTGQALKPTGIGDAMKGTAMTSGMVTAGVEAVKSIVNGDSLGEGTSHVVSKTAESVVTAAASTAAAEAAFGAASTLLAGSAIPVVGPLIAAGGVALGVSAAVGEVTDGLFDDIGDGIGEVVEDIGDAVSDVFSDIGGLFDSLFF